MFITLFKHEWKANVKLFTLLSACVIGVGCLAAVVLRLITTYWEQLTAQDGPSLLLIPAFLILCFALLALNIYSMGIFYAQLFRFYKSRFTDQGYLMFTLPVKTSHIFLSSALHILVWSGISVLVEIAALAIALGLGPAWNIIGTDFIAEIWDGTDLIYSDLFTAGDIAAFVVCGIIMIAYSIIIPMSAVVLGCTIAKKHKVLAIIGILYGVAMVSGIGNTIVSFVTSFQVGSTYVNMISPIIRFCVFPLILTVIAYPLSIHLMKDKLNLP